MGFRALHESYPPLFTLSSQLSEPLNKDTDTQKLIIGLMLFISRLWVTLGIKNMTSSRCWNLVQMTLFGHAPATPSHLVSTVVQKTDYPNPIACLFKTLDRG
ncbi:hypothetical protein PM082_023690 [Marasmius tenuissimus]|nr:hypothetical protein PM082_023690 [Marasmius tenuissimus]